MAEPQQRRYGNEGECVYRAGRRRKGSVSVTGLALAESACKAAQDWDRQMGARAGGMVSKRAESGGCGAELVIKSQCLRLEQQGDRILCAACHKQAAPQPPFRLAT